MGTLNLHKVNFAEAEPADLPRMLNRLVGALDDVITPMAKSPLSSAILVKDISLKGGELNYISHGMGIIPQSFIVCKINNLFNMVKLSNEPNLRPDLTIILESTTDAKVDILFF